VFVYLEDVDSTGKSTYVTEGVLRASHRKLATPPFENFGLPWTRSYKEDISPLPDRPTELVFDLLPTAKRFNIGHRMQDHGDGNGSGCAPEGDPGAGFDHLPGPEPSVASRCCRSYS
jgi:hypothetical protein